MFVRIVKNKNTISVRIVHNVRENGKVMQKLIQYLGVAKTEEELEKLKILGETEIKRLKIEQEKAQGLKKLPFYNEQHDLNMIYQNPNKGRKAKKKLSDILPVESVTLDQLIEDKRVVEGVHEVLTPLFSQLGYDDILTSKKDKERLLNLVLSRIVKPESKHKTQKSMARYFNQTHDLDALYRTLDKVHAQIPRIKTITFEKTKELFPNTNFVLYDVTTLAFETEKTDKLRAFGYSKDCKFNTSQVVLALASNQDGLPIGYELFQGNKAEVSTLMESIESWKQSFNIQSVTFVADRAMMSDENLLKMEEKGYKYIVACKLKTLDQKTQKRILDKDNYTDYDHGQIMEFMLTKKITQKNPNPLARRIIISYKQERANRDKAKREILIEKMMKKTNQDGTIETKNLLTNQGIKQITKTDDAKTEIDYDKINKLEQWDGLHGIITNIKDQSATNLLHQYKNLWKIEECFRLNKHTLSMRPIYHFKPERIEAHIAICYMAFAMLRHIEYRVALCKKISINDIIEELLNVQSSIYIHKKTHDKYRMPGKMSHLASAIYKSMNIQRSLDAHIYQY